MDDDKAPRGPGYRNGFNHRENAQSDAPELLSCAIGSQLKLGQLMSKVTDIGGGNRPGMQPAWACVQELHFLDIFSHGCRDYIGGQT